MHFVFKTMFYLHPKITESDLNSAYWFAAGIGTANAYIYDKRIITVK